MLQADSTPISSCLVESRRGMKRAMLEVVAAGVVASSQDVERYLKCRWDGYAAALRSYSLTQLQVQQAAAPPCMDGQTCCHCWIVCALGQMACVLAAAGSARSCSVTWCASLIKR
jgi:hypothetical protein